MQRFTILGIPALVDHGVSFQDALNLLKCAENSGRQLPKYGVKITQTEQRLIWEPCFVPLIEDRFIPTKEPKLYIKN